MCSAINQAFENLDIEIRAKANDVKLGVDVSSTYSSSREAIAVSASSSFYPSVRNTTSSSFIFSYTIVSLSIRRGGAKFVPPDLAFIFFKFYCKSLSLVYVNFSAEEPNLIKVIFMFSF